MSEKEFTIYRKNWVRGEGPAYSRLIRNDDYKQCCLGFYLESCGVPREDLIGVPNPKALSELIPSTVNNIPSWLFAGSENVYWNNGNSDVCNSIIKYNDLIGVSDSVREQKLTKLFAEAGVTIHFKD